MLLHLVFNFTSHQRRVYSSYRQASTSTLTLNSLSLQGERAPPTGKPGSSCQRRIRSPGSRHRRRAPAPSLGCSRPVSPAGSPGRTPADPATACSDSRQRWWWRSWVCRWRRTPSARWGKRLTPKRPGRRCRHTPPTPDQPSNWRRRSWWRRSWRSTGVRRQHLANRGHTDMHTAAWLLFTLKSSTTLLTGGIGSCQEALTCLWVETAE